MQPPGTTTLALNMNKAFYTLNIDKLINKLMNTNAPTPSQSSRLNTPRDENLNQVEQLYLFNSDKANCTHNQKYVFI